MRPRTHDGSYMDETPDTILAAMCGVSKHHEERNFEHKYLKILNITEQQHLDIKESCSKPASTCSSESTLASRYSQESNLRTSFVSIPEKWCYKSHSMINKDDLKLPNNFEPRNNVDKNDPAELLEATYISTDQGYNV